LLSIRVIARWPLLLTATDTIMLTNIQLYVHTHTPTQIYGGFRSTVECGRNNVLIPSWDEMLNCKIPCWIQETINHLYECMNVCVYMCMRVGVCVCGRACVSISICVSVTKQKALYKHGKCLFEIKDAENKTHTEM